MTKALFLAVCLLCAGILCLAQAQIPITGAGLSVPATGGGGGRTCTDDTASTNWLGRTSGLSNTEKDAYCNMIKGMESDGIITGNLSGATGCGSVLDLLYIFATNTTTTANLNLCGTSFPLTQHGSVTFAADAGYTGDGSTGYFDTGGFQTGNFAQNSSALGGYNLTSRTTSVSGNFLGYTNGSQYTYIAPCGGTGTCTFAYEIDGFTFNSDAVSNARGHWMATRTSSTSVSGYLNGTLMATHADASIGTPNTTWYVLAYNNSGSAANFLPDQVLAVYAGGNMASFANAMDTRLNNYATVFGKNVH